jgi:hypothetical protein
MPRKQRFKPSRKPKPIENTESQSVTQNLSDEQIPMTHQVIDRVEPELGAK